MNIICLTFDPSKKRDCIRGLYVVNSLYYDTGINGMVMLCADGSALVKRMSIKYYEGNFNRILQGVFDDGSRALDTSSLGAFLRVSSAEGIEEACMWGPQAGIYSNSAPSWDPGDEGSEGGMSRMRLE